MKNSLIAIACMSMIGGVQAQSSVNVYGVVDQYLDYSKTGSNSAGRIQSGGLDGSRVGFKGVEDLGGGLKALFVVEAGINADNGSSGQGRLFGRQSYVGLAGNFGVASLGRQYSPYYDTLVNYTLGGGLAWGNATEYFDNGALLRVDNSIKYESPNFSGLVFKGLFGMRRNNSPDNAPTDSFGNIGNVGSVGGQYENGPFSLGMSYSTNQEIQNDREKWTAFGIAYNFGPLKTAFLVSDVRDDFGQNRHNTYELSTTIPLTHASLLLDVGSYRNRAENNANATAYSVRYDYYMSKRTTLYTGISYIRADRNATFVINGATGAGLKGLPGDNSRALIAGIRHSF